MIIINETRTRIGREPKVCELSAGNARVIICLRNNACSGVYGVEYNKNIVFELKKYFPELNVVHGNMVELPKQYKDNDLILSYGVVEHFQKGIDKLLRANFDALKPGGIAIITIPCMKYRGFLSMFNLLNRVMRHGRKFTYYPSLRRMAIFFEYHLTPAEFKLACYVVTSTFSKKCSRMLQSDF